MNLRHLRVELADAVATITIDRSPVNAVNLELIDDFLTAVSGLAGEAAARALVITGVAGRFCAGADIAMMRDVSRANHERVRRWVDVQAALEGLAKPVIAAINGYALGGGAELVLACDYRWMAADAAIGFPEIGLGIFPGAGGTQRLTRLLGPARALDVMISGRRLTSAEALEAGLVQRVVAPDALAPDVRAFARDLAAKPTRAIGLLKRCVYGGLGTPLAEGLELERRAVFEVIATRDAAEGLDAFLEKRVPRFTGS